MRNSKPVFMIVIVAGCVPACDSSTSGSSLGHSGGTASSLGGSTGPSGGAAQQTGGDSSPAAGQSNCAEGTLGCACYGNQTCNASLICQAGLCQTCDAGTKGCACYGNQTCNAGLSCNSNTCVELGGSGGSGNGGNSSLGSEPASGGSTSVGGNASGGTTSPSLGGTSATGGLPATGGSSVASSAGGQGTGGTPVVGGTSSTGSSEAAGGQVAGGTSASGGSSGGQCVSSCSNPLVIDDFEDGDLAGCSRTGWTSGWWMSTDGYGVSVPTDKAGLPVVITPSRTESCRGLHLQGSGFTSWGAVIGLTMNNPDETVPRAVDISGYTGVSFWMRGSGRVSLQVATVNRQVESAGGTCVGDWPTCQDFFKSTLITLTSTWSQYPFRFDSLAPSQSPSVKMTAADLKQALTLQFSEEKNVDFDVWLDEVAFF
jgi:hypothetical protein